MENLSIIGLKHLMILSLRDNCLTSLLGIETIHSLEVIIVDRNSLSSLAPLGKKSCRLVQLLMNEIKILPKYLEGLPLLQDLYLHQNRRVNLPSTIFCGMNSLTCLDIGKHTYH